MLLLFEVELWYSCLASTVNSTFQGSDAAFVSLSPLLLQNSSKPQHLPVQIQCTTNWIQPRNSCEMFVPSKCANLWWGVGKWKPHSSLFQQQFNDQKRFPNPVPTACFNFFKFHYLGTLQSYNKVRNVINMKYHPIKPYLFRFIFI